MGTSIKPLMKANQAADDSVGGDHSRRPPQSDRVPSPRLILSHRALSLGGYRAYSCTAEMTARGLARSRLTPAVPAAEHQLALRPHVVVGPLAVLH